MTRSGVRVILALACLAAWPAAARAQSAIAGVVKDTSGGVLPGVTVEVSSDALIERTRSTTTDGGGQYRIVDLRPGMYTVTFTLTGFAVVKRDAFQLQSDFTASISVEMKVGALQETVTVTGAAPIVDVQSAAHVQVLDRESIDNIPTGKTIQGLGQLIVGVQLSSPDVGGSAGAQQTYMSVHGQSSANNTVMVDGMVINGLQGNGSVQTYSNDADYQEMSYQTTGVSAERSGGGVTLNMVPKEGGNRFSGSSAALYRPGQLQGDNYSNRFKVWGLPVDRKGDPAINRIHYIRDITGSFGGPIQKDKVWYFVSLRDFDPVNTVPNTFFDDGSQGVDDNFIRDTLVRLTYQVTPRHKVSAYYERVFKYRAHVMGAFTDPETASFTWPTPNYSTAAAKYTGTLSSRLLLEGGYSQNVEYYRNLFQPGIGKARGTPEWYTVISHLATGGGTGVAPAATSQQFPVSMVWQGSASYVTGSHHAKVGAAYKHGRFLHGADSNGDLQQVYPTGTRDENYNNTFPTTTLLGAASPCSGVLAVSTCSVTVRNTPRLSQESLIADIGLFAQDSFTMKRLTVSAGIRYETINSQVDEMTLPAGRFVPTRTQPERPRIPNWKDWAPRFQVVYDLFGDSRTAIKYSINRYNVAETTSTAANFNGLGSQTSSRNWTDLNMDDIAQGQRTFNADGTYTDCVYLTPGCEINLSGTASQLALVPTFGAVTEFGDFTQYPRRYRFEQGVEVQHALLPRVSLTATYYHGSNKNLTKTVNRLRTDDGNQGTQYRKVTLYNPIDGTPYTYYNSLVTLAGSGNITYLEPLSTSKYDSYSGEFRMRPYAGSQISGGISIERSRSNTCATSYPGAIVDPNSLRFCDDWNMVAYDGGPRIGRPFTKDFKLSASFPIVYGINLGWSYQNIDSGGLAPTFRYGTAFRYPDGTATSTMLGKSTIVPACPTTYGCVPGAPTVPSNWVGAAAGTNIGTQFATGAIPDERIVQLDFKASKNFRFGKVSVAPAFEAFNLMNIDNIRSRFDVEWANANGSYLTPDNMLQGRIIGFGMNVKW